MPVNNVNNFPNRNRISHQNGIINNHNELIDSPIDQNAIPVSSTIAPAYYRQYLINTLTQENQQVPSFVSTRANDNEEDMHAIYEIDREAFADYDPYDSYEDFKNFVTREHMSAYAVKDENGDVVGYYQLEPVKNGDLYIDSMGLKSDYRNTRKGYLAINQCWDEIQQYAKDNGAQSLSLHVDATNRALVRLYERLGFSIDETLNNYYDNGADAYFMTRPLEQENDAQITETTNTQNNVSNSELVSESDDVTQEESSLVDDVAQEVEPEPEQVQETYEQMQKRLAKERVEQRVKEAAAEVKQLDPRVKNEQIKELVKECTYKTPDKTMQFSEGLFEILKVLAQYSAREEIDSYFGVQIIDGSRLRRFLEFDKDGNAKARTDLIPYIKKYLDNGTKVGNINDKFEYCYLQDSDGRNYISTEALDARDDVANTIRLWDSKSYFSEDSVYNAYKLRNKDGSTSVDQSAVRAIKNNLMGGFSTDDAANLVSASIITDTEGQQYFDSNYHLYLKKYFDKDDCKMRWNSNTGVSCIHELPRIMKEGVSVKNFLDHAGKLRKDEDIKNILRKFNDKKDVDRERSDYIDVEEVNLCALLKAVTYNKEWPIDYPYGIKKNKWEARIDNDAFDLIKEHCKDPDNFKFKNIYRLANIAAACKTQEDSYGEYKFSRELFDKAMMLKDAGMQEDFIPKLMECCKLKVDDTKWSLRENKSVPCTYKKFSDEIFNAVYEHIANPDRKYGFTEDSIKNSIEIIDGKERFNREVFDLLKSHYSPRRYDSDPGWDVFFDVKSNGDRVMNIRLLKKYLDMNAGLELACDQVDARNSNHRDFIPNPDKMDAYMALKARGEIPYTKYDTDYGSEETPIAALMRVCNEEFGYPVQKFNTEAFKRVQELLDKGIDGRDIVELMYCVKRHDDDGNRTFNFAIYDLALKLLDEGMDIKNAAHVASESINSYKGEDTLCRMKELYSLGVKSPTTAYMYCHEGYNHNGDFDEIAYARLKDAISKGFEPVLIDNCKDRGQFKDRLYKQALMLSDNGFDTHTIAELMKLCDEKTYEKADDNTKVEVHTFNQNMYNHISDLLELGIDKNNVYEVLKSCKYNYSNNFSEDAFSKVSDLKSRGFDDKGIAKFIEVTLNKNNEYPGKIDPERYDDLIWLTARHKDLKDNTHDDAYIIEKINNYSSQIKTAYELFGQDVMNFAMSAKIDNYITFASQCASIKNKCSERFIKDLQERLNELPSPDLRVRRLRVIGGLVDKVDENALYTITKLIKSPKTTQDQIDLANKIFAVKNENEEVSQDDFYKSQVERFLSEICVPAKTRKMVEDYLMKERLDKQIDWPKPIDEQIAQMEKFAQQMLTNPKIPLDKKIKYIDEYKAKIADMKANPDKYTSARIFAKPMTNLAKVIEAYVNIPNDDARFENSIKEAMYSKYGIETTPELIAAINYDAKYFDKLLSAQSETVTNFKRLIELKKSNLSVPLTDLRMTLEGIDSEKFDRLGLTEQIKANLDTKRQFVENRLNFDKWNKFDENLNGEVFSVEADPETEYQNVRFNIINVFQDELWNKMDPKETEKLMDYLGQYGYTIFNNHIYKGGLELGNNALEAFADTVVKYTESNKYFANHVDTNGQTVSADEIDGITGFSDHIKDHQKRIREIQGAKTVNDIHFRLSDDDNIGRNVFFGNHVGCCNSIESTHAGYSAPMHLLNTYNRGIELVDKYGNSYGNSLCFFALVDGKLTFIIDSFEANGKLASNPIVTEHLLEFAKQVCEHMGRPDAQIAVGPSYNNMNMSSLELTSNHTIKVIGTVSERTYCDSVGGRVKDQINNEVSERSLYFPKK